jgi:hypothetical protein
MTRIAVCQAWDENYQALADVTWHQNKKLYCEHWQYPYHVKNNNFKYVVSYEKIKFMLDVMNNHPDYDWLYWAGTDTLITNFYIKLESFVDENYHIIIAKDINDINADSFLIKNSPESKAYLEHIWSLVEKYNTHDWWEQQAMIDSMPQYEHLFKFVPQKTFNSFLYKQLYWNVYHSSIDKTGNDGQWAPGDFLLHVPGGGLPKLQIISQFMGLVRHIVPEKK